LRDAHFLADETIHPDVIAELLRQGLRITCAVNVVPAGNDDELLMAWALANGAVVLTHDADFGEMAVRRHLLHPGMVRVRPGHIRPLATLAVLSGILHVDVAQLTGFALVAEDRAGRVRARIRQTDQ